MDGMKWLSKVSQKNRARRCWLEALALGATVAMAAAAQPSGLGAYAPRHEVELQRLAASAMVPALYYSEVKSLFTGCKEFLDRDGSLANSFCKRIVIASRSVDSAYLNNRELNQFADSIRREIAKSFYQGFKPGKELKDPDFFRKLRFLSYLDTGKMLQRILLSPISDSTLGKVEKLARGLNKATQSRTEELIILKDRSMKTQAPMDKGGKYVLLMDRIFPGLEDFLRMFDYVQLIPSLDSIWKDRALSEANTEYETELIFDLIRDDSVKANLRAPLKALFLHKLRNLLHDAVWLEEEGSSQAYSQSSFIFGRTYVLSQADSIMITGRLFAFGRRHSNLAIRLDINNPSSLNNPGFKKLDRLVNQEIGEIVQNLSGNLRLFLNRTVPSQVAIEIEGRRFPDYMGPQVMSTRYMQLMAEAHDQGLERIDDFITLTLPAMDGKWDGRSEGPASKAVRKKVVEHFRNCSPTERNSIYLLLGPTVLMEFKGDSSRMEKVILGKIQL